MKKLLFLILFMMTSVIFSANTGNNIKFPQLNHLNNIDVQTKVNALLISEQQKDEESRIDCLKQSNPQIKTYWNENIETLVSSKKLLSLKIHYSYYCGGAYPSDYIKYLNYDLTTGSAFDFKKLFTQQINKTYPNDPIKKLAADLYQSTINKSSNPNCLEAYSKETSRDYALAFSKEGLRFILEVPHALAECAPEIIIPYKKIKPFVHVKVFNNIMTSSFSKTINF